MADLSPRSYICRLRRSPHGARRCFTGQGQPWIYRRRLGELNVDEHASRRSSQLFYATRDIYDVGGKNQAVCVGYSIGRFSWGGLCTAS